MRTDEHLTDDARHALAVIDSALDAGRPDASDPDDRELQELVLALRAESAEPDPEFAAALDGAVDRGFGRAGGGRPAATGRHVPTLAAGPLAALRRAPSLAIGAAAAALLALVVGISLYETDNEAVTQPAPALTTPAPAVEPVAPERAEEAPSVAPGGDVAPVPPPRDDESLGRENRRIESAARVTLAAPADEIGDVAGDVAAVVARHDGLVMSSSVTIGEDGAPGGTFDLRVPGEELDATLADLSELGELRSLTRSDDDITGAFVPVRERVADAEAERKSLLQRLAEADSGTEARALKRRLRQVNAELRTARDELHGLERRTNYATIALTLERGRSGAGGLGGAVDDALDSLAKALAIAIRALGILVPLAIVGGGLWLAGRAWARRRREAVLDDPR